MTFLTMGVIGTSKKDDERRVPIHPEHLKRLPEHYRKQRSVILSNHIQSQKHLNMKMFFYTNF
ncbi:hypothetical protein [Wenyingzhuangia aestuarii]|uniref:hypothetical protein n=1 Tax=Wenyingzhuangia aestuarii TaxID=1647582 RepID=UPI001438E02A|nr:hypothetical protein [Wenyingzhuangia aestuarii]NJB84097.1 hypothetical protein [Wenyingzhuangia aestuarii]